MKKFTLLLTAVLFALPSLARDFEYNGLTYTVLDEDARTCETKAGEEWTTGNEAEGDLVIPSTVYDVDIAYSVTKIGDFAFFNCISLTSIEIPSSVTEIGDYALSDCWSLPSVEIPSSVTKIGGYTFKDCWALSSVEIPSSVTEIGMGAFGDCTLLNNIFVSDNNPVYCSQEGVLFDKACECLCIYPSGRREDHYTIPSSVIKIGDGAFYTSWYLTSVEIPSSVTEIGNSAFEYCHSLVSVEIPSSVTEIGDNAFAGCSSLLSVEIPSSVTKIAWHAFTDCSSLTSIYYGAETLIDASADVFDPDTYANATLYVRESALPQAETVTPWCLFANREAFDFEVGVKGVGVDASATVEVYTLDGVKVGASTDGLPTGVYVVRQGSDVRKVAVK